MAYYLRKEKKKKGIYLQMYESHCKRQIFLRISRSSSFAYNCSR